MTIKNKKFIKFWNEDKNPSGYDHHNDTVLYDFLDVIDRKIMTLISKREYVLEIGCGTGRFIKKLKQHTHTKIYGVDPSFQMLSASKTNGINNIICSAGEMLPFADKTFDAVIGVYYSFRYIERNAAYREIYRVLKKDGILVFDIPNFYAYKLEAFLKNIKTLSFLTPLEGKIGFDKLNLKSIREEKKIIERAGFKVLNVFSRPYLPFLRRFITIKRMHSGIINTIGYDYLFLAKKT